MTAPQKLVLGVLALAALGAMIEGPHREASRRGCLDALIGR